jgi:acyl-CoA thioester hydrolase
MAERQRVSLQLRWADTDQYGHVNNVALVRYVEEARIRTFGLPDQPLSAHPDRDAPILSTLGTSSFTITAAQRFEHRAELPYAAQSIVAEVWLSRIGSSSFDLDCRLLDETGDVEYLIASVTLVLLDSATRRPRALTRSESERLTGYVSDGVAFRSTQRKD